MYSTPTCPQTNQAALFFCHSKKCSVPAFCCTQQCLFQHSHHKKQIMLWATLSPVLSEVASSVLPQQTLALLESQQKKVNIIIGELLEILKSNQKRIRQCREQLVLSQPILRVVNALKNKNTNFIKGLDMAKLLQALKETKKLYANQKKINPILNMYSESFKNLIQKVNSNIIGFQKETLTIRIRILKIKADELAKSAKQLSLAEAIKIYKQILSFDGKNHEIYYNRSECYLHRARFDRALEDLKKAIQYTPKQNSQYYSLQAFILFTVNKLKWEVNANYVSQVLQSCNKTLVLNPNHPWIKLIIYAIKLKATQPTNENFKAFKTLALQQLNNQKIQQNHRVLYLKHRIYDQLFLEQKHVSYLCNAVILFPCKFYLLNSLVPHLLPKQGIQFVSEAFKLDPESPQYLIARAIFYIKAGNYPKAVENYTTYIDLFPKCISIRIERAVYYKQKMMTSQFNKDIQDCRYLLNNGGYLDESIEQALPSFMKSSPPDKLEQRAKYYQTIIDQMIKQTRKRRSIVNTLCQDNRKSIQFES